MYHNSQSVIGDRFSIGRSRFFSWIRVRPASCESNRNRGRRYRSERAAWCASWRGAAPNKTWAEREVNSLDRNAEPSCGRGGFPLCLSNMADVIYAHPRWVVVSLYLPRRYAGLLFLSLSPSRFSPHRITRSAK